MDNRRRERTITMITPITQVDSAREVRIPTGLINFDKFLGGGFVDSQCIMLAGSPGAGKSTMLSQLAAILADLGYKTLYVSGEESLGQIKIRMNRLGTNRSSILCTRDTKLEQVYKDIEETDAKFVIVDSLQTLYSPKGDTRRGTTKQLEYCTLGITEYIKKTGRVLIAIGHANKGEDIAGLLKLEHMVDATFFIKVKDGERLMIAKKNRFGNTDLKLRLTMTERGLTQFNLNTQPTQEEKPKSQSNWKTNLMLMAGLLIASNPKSRRSIPAYRQLVRTQLKNNAKIEVNILG